MNSVNLNNGSAVGTVASLLKDNISNIIFCIVAIIVAFIATKTIKKFVDIAFEKSSNKNLIFTNILKTGRYIIFFVTIILILSKFNIPIKDNISNIIFCVVLTILAFIATKMIKKFVDIAFEKHNIKNPVFANILKKTVRYIIIFVTIMLILNRLFDIPITGIYFT